MVATVLTKAGHRVLAAEDAIEAAQLMTSQQPCVDVLIADIVLPGLSGAELAAEIAERCPKAKMIFMSGSRQPALLESIKSIEHRFLQKPYTPEMILTAVSQAIS